MPAVHDEQSLVFAWLPMPFGEYRWSRRQQKFFRDNADTVMLLLMECISATKHIGINFKQIILSLDTKKMIPLIVDVYTNNGKDHDLLTLLMLLMENKRYTQFIGSPIYKALYGGVGAIAKSSVILNASSEQFILATALKFYHAQVN